MSSAVLTALLVLQVSSVHGTSLVLNGTVGESIVLPTDEEGPIRGPGFMEWLKNNVNVIGLVREQDSSPFETNRINEAFKGRLIVNYETGALNISSLREEDSGEYDFTGIVSSGSLRPKTIQLHIYERIVSVQVTSQVNNSTDGTSCHVTLSCSVIGGSQVVLSWSRNGENIAGAESRTTLTVSLTHVEENYTCTAINPISSQSNTVTAGPCQTGITTSHYIYIAAGGGGLLVVMMVITLMCILKKSKREEAHEDTTVYAEVGDNLHTQKGSVNSQSPQPTDVNTFYDVIKGTGTPAAPSTVYDMVKLDRATPSQYQEVL
ncbi:T-lymphocyte surface antigen Ly-9-like isoform X2 [Anguilla anguilla]|uniref:T-lymphocyte surface antigen Ly-9-like isoform X2 n=1 Tax=Anguilla anguilla TaxID=7936 RepID=UPI0015AA59B2|nr:T-lymphocyte surface antigen Ly-9-like isoform X2 [Anguilla anguilla]